MRHYYCLLVHRGQNDEALFVRLDEAIHRVILILIVADFLPNALQVEADWRITDHHFEAKFAHLHRELLDLECALLVPIVDRQSVLNLPSQLVVELVGKAALHYLAPVRLERLAEDAFDWTVKHGQATYA